MRLLSSLLLLPRAPTTEGGGGGSASIERLGEMRPLNNDATATAVVEMLNAQRAALLDASADAARRDERIERMIASGDLSRTVRAHHRAGMAEWVPGGDDQIAQARYCEIDGTPRLGNRNVSGFTPNARGELVPVERVEHGFLTDPHPVSVAQKRAQEGYAEYALARAIASRHPKPEACQRLVSHGYERFRRSMMEVPGAIGEWSRSIFSDPVKLRSVISSTAGAGGELIATPTLANIIRPADIARRIAGQIPMVQAPSSTFKKPLVSGRVVMRRRQAIAADPSRFTLSTITTSDTTLTLGKFVAQVLLDSNFATDAGVILGDAIGYIRTLIAEGKADTVEMMLLHGDTAATHQDTLASWTMGSRYTAGALAGTDSALTAWIGLRARAFDNSATVAGGGAFTQTTHFGALNKLGPHAAGARMAVGLAGFYSQLLANALFSTVDKAGAAATLQTGQLGQVGDTPIDLTDFLAAEYASTGLYTGSGTTNQIVYYTPAGWRYYVGPNSQEWDVSYPEKGAQYVGAEEEALLDANCVSTENVSAVIINL
jgi:hypothetical protein